MGDTIKPIGTTDATSVLPAEPAPGTNAYIIAGVMDDSDGYSSSPWPVSPLSSPPIHPSVLKFFLKGYAYPLTDAEKGALSALLKSLDYKQPNWISGVPDAYLTHDSVPVRIFAMGSRLVEVPFDGAAKLIFPKWRDDAKSVGLTYIKGANQILDTTLEKLKSGTDAKRFLQTLQSWFDQKVQPNRLQVLGALPVLVHKQSIFGWSDQELDVVHKGLVTLTWFGEFTKKPAVGWTREEADGLIESMSRSSLDVSNRIMDLEPDDLQTSATPSLPEDDAESVFRKIVLEAKPDDLYRVEDMEAYLIGRGFSEEEIVPVLRDYLYNMRSQKGRSILKYEKTEAKGKDWNPYALGIFPRRLDLAVDHLYEIVAQGVPGLKPLKEFWDEKEGKKRFVFLPADYGILRKTLQEVTKALSQYHRLGDVTRTVIHVLNRDPLFIPLSDSLKSKEVWREFLGTLIKFVLDHATLVTPFADLIADYKRELEAARAAIREDGGPTEVLDEFESFVGRGSRVLFDDRELFKERLQALSDENDQDDDLNLGSFIRTAERLIEAVEWAYVDALKQPAAQQLKSVAVVSQTPFLDKLPKQTQSVLQNLFDRAIHKNERLADFVSFMDVYCRDFSPELRIDFISPFYLTKVINAYLSLRSEDDLPESSSNFVRQIHSLLGEDPAWRMLLTAYQDQAVDTLEGVIGEMVSELEKLKPTMKPAHEWIADARAVIEKIMANLDKKFRNNPWMLEMLNPDQTSEFQIAPESEIDVKPLLEELKEIWERKPKEIYAARQEVLDLLTQLRAIKGDRLTPLLDLCCRALKVVRATYEHGENMKPKPLFEKTTPTTPSMPEPTPPQRFRGVEDLSDSTEEQVQGLIELPGGDNGDTTKNLAGPSIRSPMILGNVVLQPMVVPKIKPDSILRMVSQTGFSSANVGARFIAPKNDGVGMMHAPTALRFARNARAFRAARFMVR